MATAVTPGIEDMVTKCTAMVSDVLRLPVRSVWLDYDEEADVLSMSFRRPQRAERSRMIPRAQVLWTGSCHYSKSRIVSRPDASGLRGGKVANRRPDRLFRTA